MPTDYDKTKLAVYRVDVDGAKTEYKTTVEGDYATIETDHFSTYVLAEKTTKVAEATNNTETTTTTTDTSKELDETPKTGTIDIINYVIALTVLAGVGIVAIKKMK